MPGVAHSLQFCAILRGGAVDCYNVGVVQRCNNWHIYVKPGDYYTRLNLIFWPIYTLVKS